MKTWVISLGGSVLIPEEINYEYLNKFKALLKKYSKNNRFVIVTGGGSIARKYIEALKNEGKSEKSLSLAGIRATRINALFLMQFFEKEANQTLPMNLKQVETHLEKKKIVICGALRYAEDETSDGTAAKLAHYLKTSFINITNVPGLFTADPRKDKKAKLIKLISWAEFDKLISKIKFHAGQHFILDQNAAKIIKTNKISTYIIGPSTKELSNLLESKHFSGTIISG